MASVRFSGPNNSTLFTTCCGTAICDNESRCPRCKEEVPYTVRERWEIAMRSFYGEKRLREIRDGYSK